MNIEKLEELFPQYSEMEAVRLLSFNFNKAVLTLVKPSIDTDVYRLLLLGVENRNHLSLESSTLDEFSRKMISLEEDKNKRYLGRASRTCGYSGETLYKAKTLGGDPEKLVSLNEATYIFKRYPWWVKAVNPLFQETVNSLGSEAAFICDEQFNLELLERMKDVVKVAGNSLYLEGGEKVPIIQVFK